ncbi:YebC/PmpR family DNA-binding transcriptional regulator [candidate division KSB1 bacterium]|nr:YebC/PmpR family DNA-binding transcriptional regulator [candidate division KSB1 bacterium]NIR70263.1 YebC/PmpR family DNA-binding transcriptional regulator [candidate division KSB1 bacterium]NIS26534.1 YebC/PmpR family DNA-binding transcriptional regulator [candidate division KSB1 bacterium]NIT73296.1 YebC/PmpR family DNA-binding transcriptional regulator [candidate division KSB1 bacterium]NIU23920.1 YebC/PmpR family DNA-binding transcriptional regulator [candidate division KSB1 bacterium]
MSGHSKWSTIKRKKAKADAERGKIFTRLIKELTIAAREGGGDESANPRLRTAIAAAKASNMPAANIDRAIKKGTGELPGVSYEQGILEGYGPGGAALFIEILTDNHKRTVAEVRHNMNKYAGSLAESGAVAWLFEKKGLVTILKGGLEEDDLLMIVMDAGAEDIKSEDDMFEITTATGDLENVKSALEENNIKYETASLTMYPKNTVKVEGKEAEQLLKLMDVLEEHEDVQNIYSNFDIDFSLIQETEE